jgi:hypothetical protein
MHPFALRAADIAAKESTDRIAAAANDPSLKWEDVSRIAGEENGRLLRSIEMAEAGAAAFVEANTDHALAIGLFMFQKAAPHVEPDLVPHLVEGVNVLVSRVRQGAEQGHPLPMHYMDPGVRKELWLVESYMRAALAEEKQQ